MNAWIPPTGHPLPWRRRQWLAAAGALALSGCAGSQTAPEATYLLLDGSRITNDDLRGKVTFVNFWATSCTTCVAEMPDMASTYQRYQSQGYDTLAVAMQYDPPAFVVNFAQSRQLPFKVAIDNTGSVSRAWGNIQLTPTSFLLDKQLRVDKTYVGAPDFAALHARIETLLSQA